MSGKDIRGKHGLYSRSSLSLDDDMMSIDFGEGSQNATTVPVKHKKQHKEVASELTLQEGANQCVAAYEADRLDRIRVQEIVELFRKTYTQLLKENKAHKSEGYVGTSRIDIRAANYVKKNVKNINYNKLFGHIPGIAIGDQFHYKVELDVVGLHSHPRSGIDSLNLNGKNYAISIVDSGRYNNMPRNDDVLIYTGHGGRQQKEDQKLVCGNQAMVNSFDKGYPIRVIKSCKNTNTALIRKDSAFVYDGLYTIKGYGQERESNGQLVYKFELHRITGQERRNLPGISNLMYKECCVLDDVSEGKEIKPICAVNGIDGEKPPSFTYLTSVLYPEWCKQIQYKGCICTTTSGCLNLNSTSADDCPCIRRNDGETLVVFECGPKCECSVSCRNRVSQHGPRYKLEIFKKETGQWGVISRSYISSGSFVCEYVGEMHRTIKRDTSDHQLDKQHKVEFIIDASIVGNVGRFIGKSSSPNLLVQHVFYDKVIPHVALFAAKSIPPLQELTLDMDETIGEFQCRIVL